MNNYFLEQMSMYSAYHRDHRNQLTHFIGVPTFALSLILPMALISFGQIGWLDVSLGVLFTAAVMIYWLYMDIQIGFLTALLYVPLPLIANYAAKQGTDVVWWAFGATFVIGWAIQLVGHAFEGRKPALTDSLLQVFIAPMFLISEVLFVLGRRLEIRDEVEKRWHKYAASSAEAETA